MPKIRLSKKQKQLLQLWASSKYGDLHIGSRDRVSSWILIRHGFLSQSSAGWSSITTKGREYMKELEENYAPIL